MHPIENEYVCFIVCMLESVWETEKGPLGFGRALKELEKYFITCFQDIIIVWHGHVCQIPYKP